MPIQHTIDAKTGIMHVKARGPQNAEASVREVWKEARENGVGKFLIDLREADFRESFTESYLFAGSLDRFGVRRSDKIAILIDPDIPEQRSRQRFSETVAVNRGFDIQVFGDETEAVKWLLE